MKSKKNSKRKPLSAIKKVYILFSCNQWKEYSSMRVKGVTTDLKVLYVMIGSEIKAGNMLYGCDDIKVSWDMFLKDYREGDIMLDMLEFGHVEIYEDHSLCSQSFKEEFPEAKSIRKTLDRI